MKSRRPVSASQEQSRASSAGPAAESNAQAIDELEARARQGELEAGEAAPASIAHCDLDVGGLLALASELPALTSSDALPIPGMLDSGEAQIGEEGVTLPSADPDDLAQSVAGMKDARLESDGSRWELLAQANPWYTVADGNLDVEYRGQALADGREEGERQLVGRGVEVVWLDDGADYKQGYEAPRPKKRRRKAAARDGASDAEVRQSFMDTGNADGLDYWDSTRAEDEAQEFAEHEDHEIGRRSGMPGESRADRDLGLAAAFVPPTQVNGARIKHARLDTRAPGAKPHSERVPGQSQSMKNGAGMGQGGSPNKAIAGRQGDHADKNNSYEWLHMVGQSMGEPDLAHNKNTPAHGKWTQETNQAGQDFRMAQHPDNLAQGSAAANTFMMAVEDAVKRDLGSGAPHIVLDVEAFGTSPHAADTIQMTLTDKNSGRTRTYLIDATQHICPLGAYAHMRDDARAFVDAGAGPQANGAYAYQTSAEIVQRTKDELAKTVKV